VRDRLGLFHHAWITRAWGIVRLRLLG
jgi:hypothetical protein